MKSVTGTSGMVRQINRERIRDALKAVDAATLAELARSTGLSVATCSNLMPELVESGEAALLPPASKGGRPARRFAYNPNYALALALLFMTTGDSHSITWSVRNGNGESVKSGRETHFPLSLREVDALVARLVRKYPAVKAAALSIPGIIAPTGELELCDIRELTGVNLDKHITERHGLRTITENDMNFAALGYYTTCGSAEMSGLAYATFPRDENAGMGIVINGMLLKGKSCFAGEVSNIPGAGKECGVLDRVVRTVVAVTSVLNPDILVLSGDEMSEAVRDRVRERCLEALQARHLPDLVVRTSYEADSFAGMTAMALGLLSCDVKLVENERLWL